MTTDPMSKFVVASELDGVLGENIRRADEGDLFRGMRWREWRSVHGCSGVGGKFSG
jgi:ribosomal protein S13